MVTIERHFPAVSQTPFWDTITRYIFYETEFRKEENSFDVIGTHLFSNEYLSLSKKFIAVGDASLKHQQRRKIWYNSSDESSGNVDYSSDE